MDLQSFNTIGKTTAADHLKNCCGSGAWVSAVMEKFPFKDEANLVAAAEDAWYNKCSVNDWLEAFRQHPKIGDTQSLAEKFASTAHLAGHEQSGMQAASFDTIEKLAKVNEAYETRNGFIFIVCATGKPADEMLRLANDRLSNSKEEELLVAMNEQHKITIIRLQKLLPGASWAFLKNSQLTTHVLDTSIGKPAKDISIRLKKLSGGHWQTFAQGITNEDGRLPDLLPPGRILAGNYKIVFDTGSYFAAQNLKSFYPEVEIQFSIFDASHYHVPLLLNPYGYSTYRGS
ncbi:MAG: 2-oxo-4-hydroxy-4-carboxy-5-ureidoimidazoline decarboxylase [Ferruginibacter sp.]